MLSWQGVAEGISKLKVAVVEQHEFQRFGHYFTKFMRFKVLTRDCTLDKKIPYLSQSVHLYEFGMSDINVGTEANERLPPGQFHFRLKHAGKINTAVSYFKPTSRQGPVAGPLALERSYNGPLPIPDKKVIDLHKLAKLIDREDEFLQTCVYPRLGAAAVQPPAPPVALAAAATPATPATLATPDSLATPDALATPEDEADAGEYTLYMPPALPTLAAAPVAPVALATFPGWTSPRSSRTPATPAQSAEAVHGIHFAGRATPADHPTPSTPMNPDDDVTPIRLFRTTPRRSPRGHPGSVERDWAKVQEDIACLAISTLDICKPGHRLTGHTRPISMDFGEDAGYVTTRDPTDLGWLDVDEEGEVSELEQTGAGEPTECESDEPRPRNRRRRSKQASELSDMDLSEDEAAAPPASPPVPMCLRSGRHAR